MASSCPNATAALRGPAGGHTEGDCGCRGACVEKLNELKRYVNRILKPQRALRLANHLKRNRRFGPYGRLSRPLDFLQKSLYRYVFIVRVPDARATLQHRTTHVCMNELRRIPTFSRIAYKAMSALQQIAGHIRLCLGLASIAEESSGEPIDTSLDKVSWVLDRTDNFLQDVLQDIEAFR